MAKYVYHVPDEGHGCGQDANRAASWNEISDLFGRVIQRELVQRFGLRCSIFPEEDGVEIDQGCAGMGKEWFNFKFRIFADIAIYLDMINVPYEWRSMGVGEWLIGELKSFARVNGLKYIFLGSYEPSNPFWERCGFNKITDYPDFVLGLDSMAK